MHSGSPDAQSSDMYGGGVCSGFVAGVLGLCGQDLPPPPAATHRQPKPPLKARVP